MKYDVLNCVGKAKTYTNYCKKYECFCKDCSDCLIKKIIEKLEHNSNCLIKVNNQNFEYEKIYSQGINDFSKELLKMFEIEIIE